MSNAKRFHTICIRLKGLMNGRIYKSSKTLSFGTYLIVKLQKSSSARLGGLSNAWRRWWSTKRHGKPAMVTWFAWGRIHAGGKTGYEIITNDKSKRGCFKSSHHRTGVVIKTNTWSIES